MPPGYDPGVRCTAENPQKVQFARGRNALVSCAVALLAPALLYGWILHTGYDGLYWMRGDCPYYVATALSLMHDGDLDLGNQFTGERMFSTGQVALDQHGRIVPMHPVWLSAALVPWLAVLGLHGALVFNVVQIGLLLVALFVLARTVASDRAAAGAVALVGMFSMLPHYVWNVSPDVFLTLATVAGLIAVLRGGPGGMAFAGVAFGLAVTARPTFVLVLLPALLLLPNRRALAGFGLGFALPVAGWMALNFRLFGSVTTTAYDRMLVLVDGTAHIVSHRGLFGQPLFEGMRQQLVDPELGLVFSSPITLVGLAGLGLLWRRARSLALVVLLSSGGLYLAFSLYERWATSHAGNRFLMPVVALATLPLAALLDRLAGERKVPSSEGS